MSAFHYLLKPIEEQKSMEVLGRAVEEAALKRKMLARETDRRYYQSKAVSIAAYEAAGILK